MQKKLIALAIASLSGAAFAQANVTISGKLDSQLEVISATGGTLGGQNNTNFTSRSRWVENGSELRFSGEESLGNGMAAFFTIGAAVDGNGPASNAPATSLAGLLGSRNTAVGLKGAWGQVMMGRWDVHYTSQGGVDNTFGGLATSSLALLHTLGQSGTGLGGRLDNVFAYVSPNFNGFQVLVGYTRPNEQPVDVAPVASNANVAVGSYSRLINSGTANQNAVGYGGAGGVGGTLVDAATAVTGGVNDPNVAANAGAVGLDISGAAAGVTLGGRANTGANLANSANSGSLAWVLGGPLSNKKMSGWTLNPTYNNGPIHAFLSYTSVNDAPAAGLTYTNVSATNGNTYLINLPTVLADVRSTRLGGAYTFPMGLKLGLIWDSSKITTHMGLAALDMQLKRRVWSFPMSYTTGPHKFGLTIARASDLDINGASTANTGAKYTMLGYSYAFSKRTSASLSWAEIRNDTGANYDFFANGGLGMTAAHAGADPRTFQLGLRHTF